LGYGLRWTRQRSGARGQGQGGLLSVSPRLRADERRCKASSRRRLSNRHRRDAGSEYNLSLSRAAKLKRSRRACTAIAASAGASKCKDNQCHQQDVEHAQREYGDIENADQADHGVLRYTPTGCYDASATTGRLCNLCLLGDPSPQCRPPALGPRTPCVGARARLGKVVKIPPSSTRAALLTDALLSCNHLSQTSLALWRQARPSKLS
jgi:hypothetical protein